MHIILREPLHQHGETKGKAQKKFKGRNNNNSNGNSNTNNTGTANGNNKQKSRQKNKRQQQNHQIDNDDDDNDTNFRNSLLNQGNIINEMDSDGNCLFRSISDQLYHDNGSRHDIVRHDVCEHLSTNKEEFKHFLLLEDDDEDVLDIDEYIEKMRQDGEWGGNVEIVVASRVYKRNIMVFSGEYSNGALQIVCDDDDEKEKKNGCGGGADDNDHGLLLSYHGNDHYNSVHTIDGMKKMKQSSTKENDSALPSSSSKVKQKGKAVITTGSGDGNSKKDTVATSQSTTTTAEGKSRNRPPTRGSNCPCGSGKKYKKCCLAAEKSKKRLAKHVEKENGTNDSADNGNEKREDSFIGDFKVLTI